MLLIRTGRRINEVLLMDFDPLLPLVGQPAAGSSDELMVARMHYRQTKVQSLQSATIPVDAEIVAIIRAQQQWVRNRSDESTVTPRGYLFIRERRTASVSVPTRRRLCSA